MMRTALCGVGKWAAAGSRLPRHIASPATARLLSTTSLQSSRLIRPRPLRQGFVALPGSTRSLSLFSSKPPPAVPSDAATPSEPNEAAAQLSPSDAVDATSANLSEASSVIPSDTGIVSDASSSLADALSTLPVDAIASIAPLHYGDLAAAGLTSFFPPGLCIWGLEALQVSTGMPWFWTIVAGSFAARLLLIPFAASSMSNAAKLAEHQPEMKAVQAQVKAAYEQGNQIEMQRAALAQRALFKRIGVNPLKNLIPMFVQLPVTIGLFLGVKRMCDFPVEQLKISGVSFLTDLTVPDPTWVLPILGAIAMNAQITLSARDMATSDAVPHMINAFRVLSVVGTAWIGFFPAGTQLTILMGTLALGVQTLLFRVPMFRRLFGLPLSPKNIGNKSVSIAESFKYAKNWFTKESNVAREQARTKQTVQTITRRRR